MRAMPIQAFTGSAGMKQLKAAFRKNYIHYLQEALGLGIFMISACFFSAMLFSEKSTWIAVIPGMTTRNILMGIAMGSTALFIFYSGWTAPSGSQINPAVTLTFLRLNKMCKYDALFFIIAQLAGGIVAVYLMQWLMGSALTEPPVRSAVTVPGKYGPLPALITEFIIAFATMSMVLFTSAHTKLKHYTRIFSAIFVCAWVILAGPLSGFGMNPARTLASSIPAGIWTGIWIYLLTPFAGMLTAAEFYLLIKKSGHRNHYPEEKVPLKKKKFSEPLEFML